MHIEHEKLEELCRKVRSMRDNKNDMEKLIEGDTLEIRSLLKEFEGDKWEVGGMKVSLSDMTRMDSKVLIEELLKAGVNGEVIERAKEAATKTNVGARLNIVQPKTLLEVFS